MNCLYSTSKNHAKALRDKAWLAFDFGPGIEHCLWRLQKGVAEWRLQVPLKPDTGAGSQARCRIACFEIGSNFDKQVLRCSPRPPSGVDRDEAVTTMLDAWMGLLRADKINQIEAVKAGRLTLPKLPLPWGQVGCLDRMPCVIWVHIPQRVEG